MSTELTVPGSSSILNNRMLCEHSIVMNKKRCATEVFLILRLHSAFCFPPISNFSAESQGNTSLQFDPCIRFPSLYPLPAASAYSNFS